MTETAESKPTSVFDRIAARLHIKSNIFTKYFLTFGAIFLVLLVVLGVSLVLLVNNYTAAERTALLRQNVESISATIEGTLITQDMNYKYSLEKELLCETLATVSDSIDADVFVCDTEGNIILCRDRAATMPVYGYFTPCDVHDNIAVDSNVLSAVYQEGEIVSTVSFRDRQSFVVGTPIYSDGRIIGSVFAVAETGFFNLSLAVFRIFLISAFLSFISVLVLFTKKISPFLLVMLPSSIVNEESPSAASPDMDWYIIIAW